MTTPTTPAQEQYIEANGLNIYYKQQGSGQPLILIHGGILTADSWQPYLPAFTERYNVFTPDTRGHGRTNNPTGHMSFGALAEDVVAFIKALNIEKPFICGYSDGGQVALEIGMRYPDLPRGLIIGGAYPEITPSSQVWVSSVLGDPQSPDVDIDKFESENPEFAAELSNDHGDNWKALLQNIKPMWNATLNYEKSDFAKVTAPTLVLLGDRDDFVSVEDGAAMYRNLPNAEMAVIPNANHPGLIFDEAKIALVLPIMLSFLRRHTA